MQAIQAVDDDQTHLSIKNTRTSPFVDGISAQYPPQCLSPHSFPSGRSSARSESMMQIRRAFVLSCLIIACVEAAGVNLTDLLDQVPICAVSITSLPQVSILTFADWVYWQRSG